MSEDSTLYIHIGTVKTGSTYIQKTFFQNLQVFEKFGISYPYIFPPALNLPRYANAEFTIDRSRDNEAREAFLVEKRDTILISDEGFFETIERLKHPAFENFRKKFILYVRPAAELICSWAAENSEPYNAFVPHHSSGIGPVSIDEGIRIWSDRYEQSIQKFICVVDELGADNFIVRPFERSAFPNGDLLKDFLACMNIDADEVRSDDDFRDPGMTNEGRSRKFCDISVAIWQLMGKPNQAKDYNVSLVEAVVAACKVGDERNVIETISDSTIKEISDRFAFFEDFLSTKFRNGEPFFSKKNPSAYKQNRQEYLPIDRQEVCLQTSLTLLKECFGISNPFDGFLVIKKSEVDDVYAEKERVTKERDEAIRERDKVIRERDHAELAPEPWSRWVGKLRLHLTAGWPAGR